jgi:5-methylcytosine-specific restriction enzyme subunit McrC
MNVIRAFEFGSRFPIEKRDELENYLKSVWNSLKEREDAEDLVEQDEGCQGFLSFDGDEAKARNFVGFIQSADIHLEIYPKVFAGKGVGQNEMLRHMFFWFDYCRKWKFPNTNVQLEYLDQLDLPELIINLIAVQILEVVSASPISMYEEVEETLSVPKGRINFNRYVNNNLSKGNFHRLECDYEPLLFDNKLNRAIKYVARLLAKRAKFSETQRLLYEITFILDEVEDCPCTAASLDEVKLNPFFTDYRTVIGLCKMVLDHQVYSNDYEEQSHWSLLLPMEYIFEDFIAGFLEKHFSAEWKVDYQKSEMYLTDEKVFNMQHDIYLTLKSDTSKTVIVDTKYKLRGDFKKDLKKGIAQSDLYQMVSYATRRGCKCIVLLYPNINEQCEEKDSFTITSAFSKDSINITAVELPFWSKSDFPRLTDTLKSSLQNLLDSIKKNGSQNNSRENHPTVN